jgi:hypothetical protein
MPRVLIFRVVAYWQTNPEARLATLGLAMAAARQSKWEKAADHLDTAVRSSLEAPMPGLARPTLR